ncbi:MAG: phospho-N-acetylmuramoyl-pentapeptide-transferase [Phycisphaerales bacterium]|nr:phospho-N-acetylmuramoyl-pentapeptide-transferase [Phycisphaerales bacterium]
MLYALLDWLLDHKPYAHQSALFRGALAILMAFAIVWLLAPPIIRMLVRFKIGDRPEFDHATLNQLTQGKKNTPTMGGLLIVIAILLTLLLLGDLSNFYVRMAFVCAIWLAALGGIDDWLKLTADRRAGTRDGIKMLEKLCFQVGLGALLAIFIYNHGLRVVEQIRWIDPNADYTPFYNVLSVPFYKGAPIAQYLGKDVYGVRLSVTVFSIIAVIVIAGTSNAVNLTDGMDGLASGCVALTSIVFMVIAFVVGQADFAIKLLLYPITGADELAILCGAIAGACLGFLWYNSYPAQIFMGDTGSLTLGGLIGYVAIVTRTELMLFIVGGVFVLEAISVLIQIFYYKTTGKRFFRCAPVHHHFHLGGWTETQVVMRFWLVGALFATFALATLKLR